MWSRARFFFLVFSCLSLSFFPCLRPTLRIAQLDQVESHEVLSRRIPVRHGLDFHGDGTPGGLGSRCVSVVVAFVAFVAFIGLSALPPGVSIRRSEHTLGGRIPLPIAVSLVVARCFSSSACLGACIPEAPGENLEGLVSCDEV